MKWIFVLLFFVSCARAPLEKSEDRFRLSSVPSTLQDSGTFESLRAQFLLSKKVKTESFSFAGRTFSKADYYAALEKVFEESTDWESFHRLVRENFEFYEVYGNTDGFGNVLCTGYYEPIYQGSKKRTKEFSTPVFSKPKDLVVVETENLVRRLSIFEKLPAPERTRAFRWNARLLADEQRVVPYFTRRELAEGGALRGNEIVWLNSIDAFFLEIQGSGVVELGKGKSMRLSYAGANGHPYESIGKFLLDRIPLEQMSMQRIRSVLEQMPPEQAREILWKNSSQVFFQEGKLDGAATYSGVVAVARRTIATDSVLFPKGLLHFLTVDLPRFTSLEQLDPEGFDPHSYWVFDLDTGGAIRGGGRVDFFVGQGAEAGHIAGAMKQKGKLWVIVPKESFLEKIRKVVQN